MAIFTTSGTSSTVAPTFEITSVNPVANMAITVNRTTGETLPIKLRIARAIHAAVPVFSVAMPSGIRPANKKTVRQSTARYASSIVSTLHTIIPKAPVIRLTDNWILKTIIIIRAAASQNPAIKAFSGLSASLMGVVKIKLCLSCKILNRSHVP